MLSLLVSHDFWNLIIPEIQKEGHYTISYSKINLQTALINKLDDFIKTSGIDNYKENCIITYLKPLTITKKPLVYLSNNFINDRVIHKPDDNEMYYIGFLPWVLDENLLRTGLAPYGNPLFKTSEPHKIDHKRDVAMVEWMLSRGAGYQLTEIAKVAGSTGNLELIIFLIKKHRLLDGDVFNDASIGVYIILQAASEAGHLHVLKYFHEKRYRIPNNTLAIAAKFYHYDIVVWLSETVLITAEAHTAIVMSIFNDDYDIFLYLWKQFPDSKHNNHQLLRYAVRFNKIRMVKVLMQHQRKKSYGFFTCQFTAKDLLQDSVNRGYVEISEFLYQTSLELRYYDIFDHIKLERTTTTHGYNKSVPREFRSLRNICKYRWINHRIGKICEYIMVDAILNSELQFIKWIHYALNVTYDSLEIGSLHGVDPDVVVWLERNRFPDNCITDGLITQIIKSKDIDAINRIISKIVRSGSELTNYHIIEILKTNSFEIYALFKKNFREKFSSSFAQEYMQQRLLQFNKAPEFSKLVCYDNQVCIVEVYDNLDRSHIEWFLKDYVKFIKYNLIGDPKALQIFYNRLYDIVQRMILSDFKVCFSKKQKKFSYAKALHIMSMVNKLVEDIETCLQSDDEKLS